MKSFSAVFEEYYVVFYAYHDVNECLSWTYFDTLKIAALKTKVSFIIDRFLFIYYTVF